MWIYAIWSKLLLLSTAQVPHYCLLHYTYPNRQVKSWDFPLLPHPPRERQRERDEKVIKVNWLRCWWCWSTEDRRRANWFSSFQQGRGAGTAPKHDFLDPENVTQYENYGSERNHTTFENFDFGLPSDATSHWIVLFTQSFLSLSLSLPKLNSPPDHT